MKYKTIVIDPPWALPEMRKELTHSLLDVLPYDVMTDEKLLEFPINDFAEENCDIFLWTTKGKIHTAFHLLEAWSFKYQNFMVWNKRDGLNNNGFHHTLEFLLYGYKGKIGLKFTKPIEQYFEAKRLKHSQKPDKFYATLLAVTESPRIDIFARKRHYGFDAWGNQVEKQIEVPLFASLG